MPSPITFPASMPKTVATVSSKNNGTFMDHVMAQPLKQAIHAVNQEEKAIGDVLNGTLSEDEMARFINEADFYLKQVKAISDRVVDGVRQLSQAGGG